MRRLRVGVAAAACDVCCSNSLRTCRAYRRADAVRVRVCLCARASQRFCVEHKLRLTKLNNIFLTRADSAASNGLPGLFLTMADVASGASQPPVEISLYGPPRTTALMSSIATVVSNARHCRVTTRALGGAADGGGAQGLPPAYEDEYVRITPIVLRPATAAPEGAGAHESVARCMTHGCVGVL